MELTRTNELRQIAMKIRIAGLEAVKEAGSGHIGGAFSLSEIMTVLYFEKMNIQPENAEWEDRDRFVLSKGHATVALYPTLAIRGFFPTEHLKTFRKIDSNLSGHAEMKYIPGVDMSTGSLGQGLSAAVGMALSGKTSGKDYYTYAIMGDGETQEGQIWEAAMFAANYKLDNLIAFVDNNGLQLDGPVKEVMDIRDVAVKFAAFGWNTITLRDGHDIAAISDAVDEAKKWKGKPTVIVAKTIKGKGVSFMENNVAYHGHTPNEKEFDIAFVELKNQLKGIEV
ncbi:MAG: transketolase [Ruminiclostridium sp.]